jgi:hypothetical protein
MKRALAALLLAGGTTLLLATPANAQPLHEPASCQGYLASYANPNMGFIIHELVQPNAADAGVTVGQFIAVSSHEHSGGLEACIPE